MPGCQLITYILGYLKDSNAAAHSVANDIFYVVIDLSARSKSYIITFIFSLWLNDRQPVTVFKSLNDRQSDIFLKFKETKEPIQFKLSDVD